MEEKFKNTWGRFFNLKRSRPTASISTNITSVGAGAAPSTRSSMLVQNMQPESAVSSHTTLVADAAPAVVSDVGAAPDAPDAQQVANPHRPPPHSPKTTPSKAEKVTDASRPEKTPWEKAIEKLHPDDQKEFNLKNVKADSDTIKHVLEAADAKRKECEDKRWKCKNWDGKEVFLGNIADCIFINLNKIVEIGTVGFGFGLRPAPAAWFAFLFLLKVNSTDIETMGSLLSGLEDISRILGRCAVYEALYNNYKAKIMPAQNLINSLPDLYAAILTYLCRSKRFFRRPTAERTVVGSANTYTTKFLPLMEKVKNLEASIENAAGATADKFQAAIVVGAEKMNLDEQKTIDRLQQILDSLSPLIEIKDKLEEITNAEAEQFKILTKMSKRLEDAERFEILTWLSEVDYRQHDEFISSARLANTGDWLLKNDDFITWYEEPTSSIFWLHGIAGSGKTFLASKVIDEPRPTNHALAYFYCKYGENDREEPRSILSTIVKQLSLLYPQDSLPKAVVSLYHEQKKNGVKSTGLSIEKSTELILQLSGAFMQTDIIVNALDECNKERRNQLLDALKKLQRSSPRLKIFITSQYNGNISLALKNETQLFIEPSDNFSDIQLFVVAEVGKCISDGSLLWGRVRPELKQTIIDTLTEGAGGMFLWVSLQIRHICQEKSEKAIRLALKRLPKGLEETYKVIWRKILADTTDNRRLAESTLQWIIYARSPLTVKEIIEATSITPKEWTEMPDHDDVTHMTLTLLDVCQNFVVLDKKLGVLRTAHFSVTEFLLNLEQFPPEKAHTTAAEVCLTLLCSETHVDPTSRQTETYILDNYALRDYVMKYWAEHIRLSGNRSIELQIMFFNPSRGYSEWLRAASKRDPDLQAANPEKPLNPLWVACYFRLWDIFKYLLRRNPDCTMRNRFGTMPIHSIARHGYSEGVKLLLNQEGVDLNAKNDLGEIPLHTAACNGHQEVVRLLLQQEGVDLNAKTHNGRTPLHAAAYNGQDAMVRVLLAQKGIDFNAKTVDGETPLHTAEGGGNEAAVRLLLEHKGMDLNAETERGETPLHTAANNGQEGLARLILEQKGVKLNAKNDCGETPLYTAAYSGHEAVVRILLEQKGVKLNAKNNRRETPLYTAANNGHDVVVRLLLEQQGTDLNAENDRRETPLYIAANNGHDVVVRMLLEQQGVDINAVNDGGQTPLHIAAYNGHISVVQQLLTQEGMDVDTKCALGSTPLFNAAYNGQEAVVRLLLEHEGVDFRTQNEDGLTPLHVAAYNGHEDVVRLLLEEQGMDVNAQWNDGPTPLFTAALNGQAAVVRLILDQKYVDLNAKCDDGQTPLFIAAHNGHEGVVRSLLSQEGIDLNAKDDSGGTPLHAAARRGHESVVKLILAQKDVDFNAKNDNGETPLFTAAYNGHAVVFGMLLEQQGVDVNAVNDRGQTSLHAAADKGHEAVVQLLLPQKGVDLNAKDDSGGTPLHAAAHKGHESVVRLLLAEQNDIDANAKNDEGETPRDVAAKRRHRRHVAVVRLLDEMS